MSRMKYTDMCREICKKYFEKKCDVCPLRPACCANVERAGGFKKWEAALNTLARTIWKSEEL